MIFDRIIQIVNIKKFIFVFGVINILFALFSCDVPEILKEPAAKDVPFSQATNVAFVLTTDYQTGSYSTIDIQTLKTSKDLGMGHIHSDACVRASHGRVYIINRLGRDNIQTLDPIANFQTINELSMGTSSNPHDIILVSQEKAYVTRYGEGELWIINPSTNEKIGEIDISEYADSSTGGKPRMSHLYYHADTKRLFVEIQRLKADWYPADYSSAVVIDTETDSVITEIKLQWGNESATNPYTHFRYVPREDWQPVPPDNNDHIFVSCVGYFGFWIQLDCGIVAIDIQDMECEEGYVFSEETANAEITEFVIKSGTVGYATTSDADFHSKLLKFNPTTGELIKTLREDEGEYGFLWSLAYHPASGKLFVCDRNALDPGVRIYDTNNDDEPLNDGDPVYVGLPPFDIVFVE